MALGDTPNPNDATTLLNAGTGGDTMNESLAKSQGATGVPATVAKTARVVITGEGEDYALTVQPVRDGEGVKFAALPVVDATVRECLACLVAEQKETNNLLRLLVALFEKDE